MGFKLGLKPKLIWALVYNQTLGSGLRRLGVWLRVCLSVCLSVGVCVCRAVMTCVSYTPSWVVEAVSPRTTNRCLFVVVRLDTGSSTRPTPRTSWTSPFTRRCPAHIRSTSCSSSTVCTSLSVTSCTRLPIVRASIKRSCCCAVPADSGCGHRDYPPDLWLMNTTAVECDSERSIGNIPVAIAWSCSMLSVSQCYTFQ